MMRATHIVVGAQLLAVLACSPAPSSKGMVSEEALAIAVQKNVAQEEAFVQERAHLQAQIEQLTAENVALKERLGQRSAPASSQAAPAPAKAQNLIDFVSLAVKPIDSNTSSTTYSWQAVVRNNSSQTQRVLVTVNFLDADGFKLDYGNEPIVLSPNEQRSISDTTYVSNELAARVAKYSGQID